MKLTRFFSREENSTGSAALILMVSLILANLLGLLKLRLFAHLFSGASSELGLFFAADRLPNFVFSILGVGALSASFVPIVSRYVGGGQKEKAFALTSTLFNFSLAAFLLLALLFFPFSRTLSGLLSWGARLSPEQFDLLNELMRILFLAQIFFILSAFASGILQSFGRFRALALPPIIYNLVIIAATYFLSPRLGIAAAAWGTVLGAFFHFLVQIPFLAAVGFRFLPRSALIRTDLGEIARLFLPRALSLAVSQVGLLFFTIAALSLSASSVVILSFAQRLMILPVTLFGSTFSQASFAALSQKSERPAEEFLKIFGKVFNYLSFLTLPVSVFFIVLRIPLVRLFFGARGFDLASTTLTANTLSFLALGIFFESQVSLLSRAFFAQRNTATPLKSALVSLLVGLTAAFLFFRVLGWGIWSLGLASAIISFLDYNILYFYLARRFRELSRSSFLWPSFKMLCASLVAGLFSLFILKFFDSRWPVFDTRYGWGVLNLTLFSLGLGGATYLAVSYAWGIREGQRVVGLLKSVRNFGPNFLAELFQE